MRRVQVNDRRNSSCGSGVPLSRLNFSNWYTDDSFGEFYLHVNHKCNGTIHRIRCKHCLKPRLECKNGELYWLIDKGRK
jgi:hypothetical protein